MGLYREEINRILAHIGMIDSNTYLIGRDRILFCGVHQQGIIGLKKEYHWFWGEQDLPQRGFAFVFRIDTTDIDIQNILINVLLKYNIYYFFEQVYLYINYLHFNIPADQINKIGKQLFEDIKTAYKVHQSEQDEQLRNADEQACRNLRKIVEGE